MRTEEPTSSFSGHDIVVGLWRLAQWNRRGQPLARWTRSILDLGIDTFDLADIYGDYSCEAIFGEALRGDPGLRDQLRLVTKCNIKLVSQQRPEHARHGYDTSAEHIIASAEHSLSVLGTDHLDLLLLHRQDPLMDPHEVAEAFEALHAQGKVLRFGVSNFTPSHQRMLASYVKQPLVTNQVEASVLRLDPFEDGTFDLCLEARLRPMAWSPLGGGRLWADQDPATQRVRSTLERIAGEHGVGADQVALAFLMRHPARIHPITGTGRSERIRAAAEATQLQLRREEWFEIWCASKGAPLP